MVTSDRRVAGSVVTCQTGDVLTEGTERPVLEFIGTVAERGTTDLEELGTPSELAVWIARSGLVDTGLTVTPVQLVRARSVREAMSALLTAAVDGTEPPAADRALVNAAAARSRPVRSLDPGGRVHRDGDLGAVLAALAEDCLDLLGGPDRSALHGCADPTCTRLYVDRSRGQRRRWCGMKGCGDRAKAAAYRQRRRDEPVT